MTQRKQSRQAIGQLQGYRQGYVQADQGCHGLTIATCHSGIKPKAGEKQQDHGGQPDSGDGRAGRGQCNGIGFLHQ